MLSIFVSRKVDLSNWCSQRLKFVSFEIEDTMEENSDSVSEISMCNPLDMNSNDFNSDIYMNKVLLLLVKPILN